MRISCKSDSVCVDIAIACGAGRGTAELLMWPAQKGSGKDYIIEAVIDAQRCRKLPKSWMSRRPFFQAEAAMIKAQKKLAKVKALVEEKNNDDSAEVEGEDGEGDKGGQSDEGSEDNEGGSRPPTAAEDRPTTAKSRPKTAKKKKRGKGDDGEEPATAGKMPVFMPAMQTTDKVCPACSRHADATML